MRQTRRTTRRTNNKRKPNHARPGPFTSFSGPLLAAALLLPACGDDGSPSQDPCDPNPCTQPHRTACTAVDGQAECSCTPGWVDDGAGGCIEEVCDPACPDGQHCESQQCVDNVCDPPCGSGETCLEHGADACQCGEGPRCPPGETCLSGQCLNQCEDGLDNDSDGWTDSDDPDCSSGNQETGQGTTECNDGVDNDQNGLTDAGDPGCDNAQDDDESGGPLCADECLYGDQRNNGNETCDLWDEDLQDWVSIGDGSGSMHHRARLYNTWIRNFLLPEGGVANAFFTDVQYDTVASFAGIGDSAIWTGTYLAAEALRALVTGSPDAVANVDALVTTLHVWFTIEGNPGYLARHAMPANGDSRLLAEYDPQEPRVHLNQTYQGQLWHWLGHISRDQYQGVMLGYSLAYEATADPQIKEWIRDDVVEFVEQLMRSETKMVDAGLGFPIPMQMQYCVFTDKETSNGNPEITVDSNNYENSEMYGFQEFHPNPAVMLRSIPGLGGLPDIPRADSAIMLASFFKVALQVTENQPAYAARRQAIQQHYNDNVGWWFDFMEVWGDFQNQCGESYYAMNISFEPMYNLARLETDPTLRTRIIDNTLDGEMWTHVGDHKQTWFAYIYAANMPPSPAIQTVVSDHNAQLAMFSPAPRVKVSRDNTGQYSEDPNCPGNADTAIDVDTRRVDDFIWQRHPWTLVDTGHPLLVFPGVDYMAAYWLGRRHGFLTDDVPTTCLKWRTVP